MRSKLPLIVFLNFAEEWKIEEPGLLELANVEFVGFEEFSSGKIEKASVVILHSLAFLPRAAQRRLHSKQVILCMGSSDKTMESTLSEELGLKLVHVDVQRVDEVADTVLALILSLLRRTHIVSDQGYSNYSWLGSVDRLCKGLHRLKGLTLGLIGADASARAVAIRAHAFGMKIKYFDVMDESRKSSKRETLMQELNVERILSLKQLLSDSDIISFHCSLTDETLQILNEDSLGYIKPGSYLVNVCNPDLIDDVALKRALLGNKISGCALAGVEGPNWLEAWVREYPNVLILPRTMDHSEEALNELRKRTIEILQFYLTDGSVSDNEILEQNKRSDRKQKQKEEMVEKENEARVVMDIVEKWDGQEVEEIGVVEIETFGDAEREKKDNDEKLEGNRNDDLLEYGFSSESNGQLNLSAPKENTSEERDKRSIFDLVIEKTKDDFSQFGDPKKANGIKTDNTKKENDATQFSDGWIEEVEEEEEDETIERTASTNNLKSNVLIDASCTSPLSPMNKESPKVISLDAMEFEPTAVDPETSARSITPQPSSVPDPLFSQNENESQNSNVNLISHESPSQKVAKFDVNRKYFSSSDIIRHLPSSESEPSLSGPLPIEYSKPIHRENISHSFTDISRRLAEQKISKEFPRSMSLGSKAPIRIELDSEKRSSLTSLHDNEELNSERAELKNGNEKQNDISAIWRRNSFEWKKGEGGDDQSLVSPSVIPPSSSSLSLTSSSSSFTTSTFSPSSPPSPPPLSSLSSSFPASKSESLLPANSSTSKTYSYSSQSSSITSSFSLSQSSSYSSPPASTSFSSPYSISLPSTPISISAIPKGSKSPNGTLISSEESSLLKSKPKSKGLSGVLEGMFGVKLGRGKSHSWGIDKNKNGLEAAGIKDESLVNLRSYSSGYLYSAQYRNYNRTWILALDHTAQPSSPSSQFLVLKEKDRYRFLSLSPSSYALQVNSKADITLNPKSNDLVQFWMIETKHNHFRLINAKNKSVTLDVSIEISKTKKDDETQGR